MMDENQESDVSALCIDVSKATPVTGQLNKTKEENEIDPKSGRWTTLLVLAGVTCCLGSALPAGYNLGVLNNPADLIRNFCNQSIIERYDIQLTHNEIMILWATIVSVFLIGGVTGSLVASWFADKFGRKGALMTGNIFGILGAILFLLVPALNSVELLLAGRLIVGLSGGLATSLLPMYMTEIAPLKLRGAVGVLCQLGITSGVFLAQIVGLDTVLGTEENWHIMLAAVAILCAIALLITFILPESPKYLYIIKEQQSKALKELSRLRNMDIMLLQNEVAGLQHEFMTRSSADTWTIGRIFREPTVRLPLFLVCSLQFGQQLTGISAVFYYSNSIFKDAELGSTGSQYATLGTGLANIAMAVISVPVMSLFHRRIVLLSSCYLCIGCLIVLCVSIVLIHTVSFMPWVCIVAVIAYVIFYGIGLGPIPFFIGSELFDVGPRPIAMSLGSVCNWGGNFLVGMLFPTMLELIGPYTFLIFTACILLLALFVGFYLPETRGRSTMEVAASITQGLRSRPNAKSVT
ncbi:solute carrier family 2, facilitated glucose transporter member 1-like isoform X1 [Polistes fuscatus]|uniref:solute carrier family 2, facilitated glucose transporter member 1-like isoform X1 n=2 Tax=Polistes fuscatus TaxID=30207 RepID=UPI001CAA3BA6|nr:solute carrier family 2, facilitated glucose transporter member 1-like isoform X1 [Polistes fuscatus]